jgi:transposase
MRFVGIDLHKVKCQICAFDNETGEIQEKRVTTSVATLEEFFKGWAPCRILMEAATESEWVARVLEKLGHEVIVANPGFAPMYATRDKKVKTDKRDARMLMEAAEKGNYRRSHRTSQKNRVVRKKLTVRDTLVATRTKAINAVRSMLRQDGYRVKDGEAETFHLRVKEMELDKELKEILKPLLDLIKLASQKIAACDKQVAKLGQSPTTQLLQSVPGVGAVTSVAFVATIDGVERFDDAGQVAAYLGLVPSESSSGEKQHRGRITKRGNSKMRWLLVQSAHSILRNRTPSSEPLHVWGNALAIRKGKRIAAVALARKLARILYAIWRSGKEYSPAALTRPVAAQAPTKTA